MKYSIVWLNIILETVVSIFLMRCNTRISVDILTSNYSNITNYFMFAKDIVVAI